MLTGSIPGDHLSHFIASNDNVDDAGLNNTFAIDVPAVHATAAKLTGLDFHDRIKHLIGDPEDKHLLSIVPSLRWGSVNMSGSSSAKIYIVVFILPKNLPCGYFRFMYESRFASGGRHHPHAYALHFRAIQSIASSRSSLSSNLQVSYLMFHSAP